MDSAIYWIIGSILTVVVLYYVIYSSVLAALREHSVWQLSGEAERKHRERKAQER